jgi:predicted CoA-binding protein
MTLTRAEHWVEPTAPRRLGLLQAARTVAVVGASSKASRASYFVSTYLLGATDFTIWFVNPNEREILGHPVYSSLAELPAPPDIVDVFRRPADLPAVAAEAVECGAHVFWAQLGLWNDDAAEVAWAGGLDAVMNRCLKIEHARFAGGLHLAGFDTGVIDSRRRPLL